MTDQIEPTLKKLQTAFKSGKTKPVEWRKQQLRQLLKGIREMSIQMKTAIENDLQKTQFVTELTSINPCIWDIEHNLKNIDKFVKDVECDTSLMLAPCKTKIRYEPLGVALIYASWNYPYVVSLKPLSQAITTGNCAVIKPSELAPNASRVIKDLIDKYLDKDCFAVIEGGPEVAAAIGNYKWDLICFTGSTQKGKLVAESAAKNLIPCIMELGGKCPVVIDTNADLVFAANKVAFARFNNSGQTCIATDYVLVHESVQKQFVDNLMRSLQTMYGNFPMGSPEMGKIITDWHCDRLKSLIDSSKGQIVCGGRVAREIKYVEPTIILNPDKKSPIMEEEIFGPVLPILTYADFQEVIDFINNKDKPLAVYYFGKTLFGTNPNKERLMNETSSGAFCTNEVMMHMVNHEVGFGGVGASGYGRYGGYEGFKQWSNPKTIMIKPSMNFYPYNQIAPPFTQRKMDLVRKLVGVNGSQTFIIKLVIWLIVLSILLTLSLCFRHQIKTGLSAGCDALFD